MLVRGEARAGASAWARPGNHGIASTFGSLRGMSRVEADVFLRSLGAEVRTTAGRYTRHTFSDESEVWLRPNGEVVGLPQREYDAQGQRINKGMRLDENGILTALHTTGERVED